MALPYSAIGAIANEAILKDLANAVFKSNLVLERMKKNIVIEDGGTSIKASLFVLDDTGTTGAWYAKGDALSLQAYDGISASTHAWRYLYESLVVSKIEMAQSGGQAGSIKILTAKMKQMSLAFSQRLMKGVISDGGASEGAADTDQIDGFNAILSTSSTYGGIAVADLSSWVAVVLENSGTPRAITQALVDQAMDNATEGGIGGPTMCIMGRGARTKFKSLLTAFQQTQRVSSVDGLGHQGDTIVYNGIDFLVENNMPSGELWFIDEKFAKLHVLKDGNFRNESFPALESQDALLNRVHLYAQLVGNERRFHAKLDDIIV